MACNPLSPYPKDGAGIAFFSHCSGRRGKIQFPNRVQCACHLFPAEWPDLRGDSPCCQEVLRGEKWLTKIGGGPCKYRPFLQLQGDAFLKDTPGSFPEFLSSNFFLMKHWHLYIGGGRKIWTQLQKANFTPAFQYSGQWVQRHLWLEKHLLLTRSSWHNLEAERFSCRYCPLEY